ncbi:MAG: nuclear transport factor 2 family protein [Blastocatellia bacterium]
MKRHNRLLAILLMSPLLAIAGGRVSSAATADPPRGDTDTFRSRISEVLAAWATGDSSKVAPFYAQDADLVFFDWAGKARDSDTGERLGWPQFADGYLRYLHSKTGSIRFELSPDLRVVRRGNVAYASATSILEINLRGGAGSKMLTHGRHTYIWERRGGKWLIVHEHVSIPMTVEFLFLQ